jgi:hypothetical protein
MPEFVLNVSSAARPLYDHLDDFARGYVEAMFFTNGDSGDEKDEWSLNRLGVERLTNEALRKIARDCRAFVGRLVEGRFVRQLLDEIAESGADYSDEQAGRDFWFTRQGHGVGFWDREQLPQEAKDALTAVAKSFGETNGCYISRGWIHAA